MRAPPRGDSSLTRAPAPARRQDASDSAALGVQEGSRSPLAAEVVVRDLQSVLAASVERIATATGCDHVVAWALRDGGEPYIAAAAFVGEPPLDPSRAEFDRLGAIAGPTALRAPEHAGEFSALAERFACDAAVAVRTHDATPLAVLLVREERAAQGSVRPRTLGVLDAAAQRLRTPLAAALALGRLRNLDAEVCRLDRLAALGSLASEIAHEVRNPLVSIKTFLQLLPDRRDDPEFFTGFLEVATSEMRRMERLLDVVLDQARPSNGEGDVAPVAAILDSVCELVRHRAHKRGIDLSGSSAPELPAVGIADDSLRQVLLNLTLNAIDATPAGGRVSLSAGAHAGGVAIAVSDSGPGVPDELRQRVFEPFFTTRDSGTGGLGLAISRRAVEEAGGTIAVGCSELGGAAFRIWLPAGLQGARGGEGAGVRQS